MSGFVGVFSLDGAPADSGWLSSATAYMAFRGPDRQGVWKDGAVGLGHTLLRTTFESTGERQPLSLDGGVWLAADARIDGRGELIGKLRAGGREPARGVPDAELILHAYHLWGPACVDHLIGDFAFALWDGARRQLFCARDQFGAVPFYWTRVGGETLLVGNTLNTLRLHPGVPATLDEGRIGDLLLFGLLPASDSTIFAAIRRLRPAHTLTATSGRVDVRRYWSPPEDVEPIRCRRPEEYVERFRSLFDLAVGDRLRSDAVATHLSGGMDSASISATANRISNGSGRVIDLRGYTIVFERLMPDDEGEFARQVAEHCGFPTELLPADDLVLHEPPASPAWMPPEPWGLPGQIAEQEILRRTSRFGRVVLAGLGGDPLLSARRQSLRELWRDGHTVLALRRLAGPSYRAVRGIFSARDPGTRLEMPGWLDPAFARRAQVAERWHEWMYPIAGADQQRGMADAPLWETVFAGNDPEFSGTPVKTRWPFFDLRLLDFMLAVPPHPWCRAKLILREAMKGRLPESVRLRRKTPLRAFPLAAAVQSDGIPAWMRELLSSREVAPYVDPARVAHLLDGPPGSPSSELLSFAPLLALAYWIRHDRPPRAGSPPGGLPDDLDRRLEDRSFAE